MKITVFTVDSTVIIRFAGVIHTDFEKGFIKADIVSYDDFVAADGSMAKIKEEGKLRQEGRDYVMADGDIVEFKFNVSK